MRFDDKAAANIVLHVVKISDVMCTGRMFQRHVANIVRIKLSARYLRTILSLHDP